MSRKRVFLGAVVAFALIAAGCNVKVSPITPNKWFFLNEGARGTGFFTNGPGIPPLGRGSALLTIDGTGREDIATLALAGRQLSTFTALQYSTYQAFSGSAGEAPTLQFDVDYDSTDGIDTYQSRLVYIPGVSAPVAPNVWQTWDTQAGAGGGEWYSAGSGASVYRPIVGGIAQSDPPCDQANYCTWAELLSNYPDARVRATTGLFLVRAGGPSTGGLSAATDDVFVAVSGIPFHFDFEPGDGTVTVNPTTAPKLSFGFARESASGTHSYVSGPAGSDGSGSAQLTVNSTGGETISTGVVAAVRADRFTNLSYKTYLQSGFALNAPTLQFDADYDDSDADTSFQGRVVFEPSVSGQQAVTASTWQTWSPLTAPSGWWQTGTPIVAGSPAAQSCTQLVPCSWAAFKLAYADAQVRPITGQVVGLPIAGRLWVKVGSGWTGGFAGNVDSLVVGVDNLDTNYNLEP